MEPTKRPEVWMLNMREIHFAQEEQIKETNDDNVLHQVQHVEREILRDVLS